MPTRSSADRNSTTPRRFSRFAPAATAVVCAGIMVVGFAELGGAASAPSVKSTGGSGCYTQTSTGPITPSSTTVPLANAAAANRFAKARTVTVTKTVTRTKTLWKTKTILKCGTKTVTRTGPGSTTTVTSTAPGTTVTVTSTQGGPTLVVTQTVTENGTSTETETETVTSTAPGTTTTETVTVTETLTPAG